MPEDNKTFLEGLGQNAVTNAAGGIIGAGMGLLLEKHNDKRQLKQQEKLQNLNIRGQQEMGLWNQARQLEMWKATGPVGQMEQLEKAGLNPGLIYGMGGAGGQTANTESGNIGGANAPSGGQEAMGLMMGNMQLGLMNAQRKKIEAETNNINADTPNKGLTGKNIEANTALTQIQTQWETIRTEVAEQSKYEAIGTIIQQMRKTQLEVENMVQTNRITRQTADDSIKIIKQQAIGAVLENELKVENIKKTKQEIDQIANAIEQKWTELTLQGRSLDIQEFKTEMEANMPEIGRIGGSMLNSIKRKLDEIMNIKTNYVRPNQVNQK